MTSVLVPPSPRSRKRPILNHTNSLILLQKSHSNSISSSTLTESDLIPKKLDHPPNQNQALNEIDENCNPSSSVQTLTTCIKRPPRKRPVQQPNNPSQPIHQTFKSSNQIVNRYIPPQDCSIPDCLRPGRTSYHQNTPNSISSWQYNHIQPSPNSDLEITKASNKTSAVNFINPSSSKSIQLFPSDHDDDWSSAVKAKDNLNLINLSSEDHQSDEFDSISLPSIVLIPPSPNLGLENIEERKRVEEIKEELLVDANTTDSLTQVEDHPTSEFSKEVAELLMGWSPWSYVSLTKTLVNQTQTFEIDPIQTSHQTKETQSNSNQKDKMRFQGLNFFKKSTHQEDKSTIPTTPPTPTPIRRKLKKSRPIPKLKPKKEKQFKNLSIKVIPNSQSEAQSIIQSTYSNIISNTNFNTNHLFLDHDHHHQLNSSQPKLISLQSAQQAQICCNSNSSNTNTTNTDHKELVGIAT